MRVVAGIAKGSRLRAVPGASTRPILDRVKTALFDILRPNIHGTNMLDLFAGSGSVGIEALSQGASHCTFLDLNKAAVQTIRANLDSTKLTEKAEVRQADAFSYIRKTEKQFNLIYVAPPQYQSLWVQAMHSIAERPDIVTAEGLIIAQIDPREYEELGLSAFKESRQQKYGNTLLLFFAKA